MLERPVWPGSPVLRAKGEHVTHRGHNGIFLGDSFCKSQFDRRKSGNYFCGVLAQLVERLNGIDGRRTYPDLSQDIRKLLTFEAATATAPKRVLNLSHLLPKKSTLFARCRVFQSLLAAPLPVIHSVQERI